MGGPARGYRLSALQRVVLMLTNRTAPWFLYTLSIDHVTDPVICNQLLSASMPTLGNYTSVPSRGVNI
jgi:hypothetical protein